MRTHIRELERKVFRGGRALHDGLQDAVACLQTLDLQYRDLTASLEKMRQAGVPNAIPATALFSKTGTVQHWCVVVVLKGGSLVTSVRQTFPTARKAARQAPHFQKWNAPGARFFVCPCPAGRPDWLNFAAARAISVGGTFQRTA